MSPSANEPVRSLGDSINVATRSVHTRLNKLILCRLPLAIPPGAKGPSHYVSGLLHITPIYHTFESLWQNILNTPPSSAEDKVPDLHAYEVCKPPSTDHHLSALAVTHTPTASQRIHSILEHVHSPQLERTESLKQDIMVITGWSPEQVDEQQGLAARFHVLSTFLEHIHQSVQERPHVLLAYAWVLYMALFSGGRFIRAILCRVHASFWATHPQHHSLDSAADESSESPVQFFTFDGPDGGDGIKLAFKKRLAESEALLTDEEREDVAVEGRRIFEFMVDLVGELDGVCRTDHRDAAAAAAADLDNDEDEPMGLMGRMAGLLGLRARDSVAVAKMRRGRAWDQLAERRRQGSSAGSKSPADDEDDEDDDDDDDDDAAAAAGGDGSVSERGGGSAGPGYDKDAGIRFRQPTVA